MSKEIADSKEPTPEMQTFFIPLQMVTPPFSVTPSQWWQRLQLFHNLLQILPAEDDSERRLDLLISQVNLLDKLIVMWKVLMTHTEAVLQG